MEDFNPIIYGLESQARALAAQLAESHDIRFFIATQSLKPNANQLHLIELNEDATAVRHATVFAHPAGEVWRLNSSPYDARTLVSVYSTQQKGAQVVMQSAILRLPDDDALRSASESTSSMEYHQFADTEVLDTAAHGTDIRTTEFHPTDQKWLATVVDGKVLLHERTESQTRVVAEMSAKGTPRFGNGKWSQHHQGNQFVALYDCGLRSFDVRDANHVAWSLDEAHGQLIRDLDCNPNKQCHLATGGDDGQLKVWDSRNLKEALFVRSDHSHWIWSVRFNTFHDQLILSSSSDCKVLLTCAGSVSSEANDDSEDPQKDRIADGLLETFDQHEDSVYCVEWSSVDPWVFASLSYDGRVIISKVPKQYKYKILL